MSGQLVFDRLELVAGSGGGQLGHPAAQPQPLGHQPEVGVLVGGDGLGAADHGAFAAFAQEQQHPAGVGHGKCPNHGSPVATLTARSRAAAQVLPALMSAASTPVGVRRP